MPPLLRGKAGAGDVRVQPLDQLGEQFPQPGVRGAREGGDGLFGEPVEAGVGASGRPCARPGFPQDGQHAVAAHRSGIRVRSGGHELGDLHQIVPVEAEFTECGGSAGAGDQVVHAVRRVPHVQSVRDPPHRLGRGGRVVRHDVREHHGVRLRVRQSGAAAEHMAQLVVQPSRRSRGRHRPARRRAAAPTRGARPVPAPSRRAGCVSRRRRTAQRRVTRAPPRRGPPGLQAEGSPAPAPGGGRAAPPPRARDRWIPARTRRGSGGAVYSKVDTQDSPRCGSGAFTAARRRSRSRPATALPVRKAARRPVR